MNRSLIEDIPWRGILKFSMPVLVGLLLQQLYNTVDTIIVGNFISQDALSAVGTTAVLTMLFLALANGFSAGAGVIIAQLFGAKKENELRRSASTSILLLTAMGLIGTVVAFLVGKIILVHVIAVPDELIEMSLQYFYVYAIGLVFQFLYNVVSAVLRGVGDSKASMYFLLVASVLNIGLDILLIAVFHMGVAGAAVATNIAQAGCCVAAVIYMIKKYPVFRWKPREFTFERERARQTLKIGFPMALQQFIATVGFVFLQRGVNGYGKYMTASFTVALRVETYVQLPCISFQITQATYTGQNLGAGQIPRIYKGAKQTVIMSELITAVISVLLIIFTPQVIGLFGISGDAMTYCLQHIRTSALIMFIFAAYFPILGIFQGAGDAFKSTIVATCALGVRVLVMYTLCYVPFFGYRIVWFNGLFGYTVGLIITLIFFTRGDWKRKWIKRHPAQAVPAEES